MHPCFLRRIKVGGVAFALGAVATLFAADGTMEDKPVPEVKEIVNQENQFQNNVQKSSDEIRDLIEDAIQNNISGALNHLNGVTGVLDEIASKKAPKVIDSIRRAANPEDAKTGLRDAFKGADSIVSDLVKFLTAVKHDIAPAQIERMLANAINKQKSAIDKARDARTKNRNLEGKPREKLSEEENFTLKEAADKQKEATDELTKAIQDLQEQAGNLAQTDKPESDTIKKALDMLEKDGAQKKSVESQNDVARNSLRTAERKDNDILKSMEAAENQLSQKSDNAARLEIILADLNETKEQQEKAKSETEKLDLKSMDAVAEAAKDQGDVSKALGDLKKNSPELSRAEDESKQAADAITSDAPKDANKDQSAVLDALNKEIKAMEMLAAQTDSKNAPIAKANAKPKSSTDEQRAIAQTGIGKFEYGNADTAQAIGWNVALSPKDRTDIEQALIEKMPAKYAKQIKLYYINLQNAKTGE